MDIGQYVEVSRRILHPDRLKALLQDYLRASLERDDKHRGQLRQLRHSHSDTEAGLARLMDLVEKGLMETTDIGLRERLVSLRFRRDELAAEISSLSQRLSAAEPVITPSKVERLAVLLRDRLQDGSPDLRQSYARLVLKEVVVKEDEIRISGSKAILARSAADRPGDTSPAVLSFVRQWCTRQDSNL